MADLRAGLFGLDMYLLGQVTGRGGQTVLERSECGFNLGNKVLELGIHRVDRTTQVGTNALDPTLDLNFGIAEALEKILALHLGLLETEDACTDDHVGGILGHVGEVLGCFVDIRIDLWHVHLPAIDVSVRSRCGLRADRYKCI